MDRLSVSEKLARADSGGRQESDGKCKWTDTKPTMMMAMMVKFTTVVLAIVPSINSRYFIAARCNA